MRPGVTSAALKESLLIIEKSMTVPLEAVEAIERYTIPSDDPLVTNAFNDAVLRSRGANSSADGDEGSVWLGDASELNRSRLLSWDCGVEMDGAFAVDHPWYNLLTNRKAQGVRTIMQAAAADGVDPLMFPRMGDINMMRSRMHLPPTGVSPACIPRSDIFCSTLHRELLAYEKSNLQLMSIPRCLEPFGLN